MTNEQKIQLADRVISLMETEKVSEDLPVMIGTLNKKQGIKGFEPAEIGHPVFEVRDRYVIYLKSETELTEKVYDPIRQVFNTKVGFFTVEVPYYKKTLEPVIDFNPTVQSLMM